MIDSENYREGKMKKDLSRVEKYEIYKLSQLYIKIAAYLWYNGPMSLFKLRVKSVFNIL